MCDIITCVIVLENLRFRPYTNDKSAFSKTSTLGNIFESLRFWCPKTPFTCALKAKTEKNCPSSKMSGCVWTGAKSIHAYWQIFVK